MQVGKQTMRTHNTLLVSFPGADGMKTGFICESGINGVASATREAASSSRLVKSKLHGLDPGVEAPRRAVSASEAN